jgi:Ca-activated chloride channel family protein
MFNPNAYYNSRPDGFGVLEIAGDDAPKAPKSPTRFSPLKRTDLTGVITGPLAALRLTQTFAIAATGDDRPIEVLYRFPLPGDAAVTGVQVRFGDTEIRTTLKERATAEKDYDEARTEGRQAALVTRESPDVFTLAVNGVRPGQEVRVETSYVQLARPDRAGWSLRIPLTTAPRYVRADEAGSRHAAGQPLAILRDPGHRFALDLTIRAAATVTSPTHELTVDADRVRLTAGEVLPDRDCVLTWRPAAGTDRPALTTWVHSDPAAGWAYFLALAAPPSRPGKPVSREVILLVDHSGSMEGAKWEAADWAVERFLSGLTEHDAFALGVFHNTPRWLTRKPRPATPEAVGKAVESLKAARDSGGTELGVALEQALDLPRTDGTRARHVLIITDAEVTDAGRLLRLAEREADRPDRRRVSVLCIDAAPNAALATELAERGGGVSRFLTSDPNEDDVTTALDEVLADWAAPDVAGLTLEVDRTGVEAVGRTVSLRAPGPWSAIDLGDPPAGRPTWVAGRVPLTGGPLTLRLTAAGKTLAECTAAPTADGVPGLPALFGADHIRRLEYLMHSGRTGADLRTELERLGYSAEVSGDSKVYAENARGSAEAVVRPLLVREALAFGLPSAETAFVAVRSEAGVPSGEAVVVANALPAGWAGDRMLHAIFGSASMGAGGMSLRALRSPAAPANLSAMEADEDFDDDEDTVTGAAPPPPARVKKQRTFHIGGAARRAPSKSALAASEIKIVVPAGRFVTGNGAVLFDSTRDAAEVKLPTTGRLTSLSIKVSDPAVTADSVGPDLVLLIFVGGPTAPRARVRLADVLRTGRRPLNLRRDAGQELRLVLEDPAGMWRSGVPAVQIVLGWAD